MFRRMQVTGLTIDPLTNSPVMMLKDPESEDTLPIWIGLLEATAIASELEQIKFSRPMTHDLFKNVMATLELGLARVEVVDLRDNTFFALLHLTQGEKIIAVDARPSDAIALALRFKAPILVAEEVLRKSKSPEQRSGRPEVQGDEAKKWAEMLENLDPDEFGKYKM